MTEVLHRSTVVQPSKKVDSKEMLSRFLDGRLERFLYLLDRYQSLQRSLAHLFSRVRIDLTAFVVHSQSS